MPRRAATLLAVTAVAALGLCAQAIAAPHFDGIFPMPNLDPNNAKIAAGPDGSMWMPIAEGEFDVAKIAPDGTVTPFKLGPEIENAKGIAAGPDGRMWITSTNKIGSFLPADPEGSVSVDTVASITSESPLVAGPDGQMWAAASDALVHWSTGNPKGAEAISVPGLQPKDIDVAGQLLVVAAAEPRIVTMTTSGVEKDYTIGYFNPALEPPAFEGFSLGVAGGPNGQFAFGQPGKQPEQIGLINPPGEPVTSLRDGDPTGVAFGSDGAYWFALAFGEGLQRMLPDGSSTFLAGVPKKYASRQIAAGPNNTLWVTLEVPGMNEYAVTRVSGLEPPTKKEEPKSAPETKLKKGPKKFKTRGKKAAVKFSFSSATKGASFECALTKKPAGKKKKKAPKPKFNGCKSPKKYKLKPGAYKFSVRAVAGGVADSSPASSSFKVVRIRSHGVG